MAKSKISQFNEEFDLKLLRYITIKKLPLIILFFTVAILAANLLLRYTIRVYETRSVIQVEAEDIARAQVYGSRSVLSEDLSKTIGVLNSRVFMDRVFSKLPLDVRYYNEGRFLDFELYTSTPFTVNYVIREPEIYGVPIYISFDTDSVFTVSYSYKTEKGTKSRSKIVKKGKWYEFPEFEFVVNVDEDKESAIDQIRSQKNFYFSFMDVTKMYDRFRGRITIDVLSESAKTIEILVKGSNPRIASHIANQIAEEFQIFDIERKAQSTMKILEYIDEQYDIILEDVLIIQDSILKHKRKYNLYDIEITEDFRRIDTLTELRNLDLEVKTFKQEIQLINNFLNKLKNIKHRETPDILFVSTYFAGSKYYLQVSGFINTIVELTQRKENITKQVKDDSFIVESFNHQISTQLNLLIEMLEKLRITAENTLIENQFNFESIYSSYFQKGVGDENNSEKSIQIYELQKLQRLFSNRETFFFQLINKKIELSFLLAGFVSQSIILSSAPIPVEPVYPVKKTVIIISLSIALLISLLLIGLTYIFYNDIVSATEINKYSSVPLLGVLPRFTSLIPMNNFIVDKYPKSIMAESLREIRGNLQFISSEKGPKVVSVTSTISGEGKSFMSLNLASALAIMGTKVIVIDLDMRKPTIHKYFKLSNKQGMSTILSGITSFDEAIQSIDKFGIKFITAGPIPPNPGELLQSDRLEMLMDFLKKDYDYIVIDNPPIGLVSDALKTLQLADYPIYLLRANYSKRTFLALPEKIFTTYNIRNLSLVLNAFDSTVSNVGTEKYLAYAYGYTKGYRKGLENVYYGEDTVQKLNLIGKIKYLFSKRK